MCQRTHYLYRFSGRVCVNRPMNMFKRLNIGQYSWRQKHVLMERNLIKHMEKFN